MQDWKLEPARDFGLSPAQRLRSLERESSWPELAFHVGWWALVRTYLRFYHRLEVAGREHLPKEPPFVLVANHTSHLDAMVLGSLLSWRVRDRVFPLAAGDTFFETMSATLFAALALNALPIWRKKPDPKDLQALRRRLQERSCGYILFPEGTRTPDGKMTRFKRGVGMLVAGTDVPVVPCYLSGAFDAWSRYRKVPIPRRLRLTIGPPLRFPGVANDTAGWSKVAAVAETAVASLARG